MRSNSGRNQPPTSRTAGPGPRQAGTTTTAARLAWLWALSDSLVAAGQIAIPGKTVAGKRDRGKTQTPGQGEVNDGPRRRHPRRPVSVSPAPPSKRSRPPRSLQMSARRNVGQRDLGGESGRRGTAVCSTCKTGVPSPKSPATVPATVQRHRQQDGLCGVESPGTGLPRDKAGHQSRAAHAAPAPCKLTMNQAR